MSIWNQPPEKLNWQQATLQFGMPLSNWRGKRDKGKYKTVIAII